MNKLMIILLIAVLLFSGCTGQRTVKNGDTVSVDYTGSLENGEVFDTSLESVAREHNLLSPSRKYEPLEFTVGTGSVIEGFEEAVLGMRVGESKTVKIPPEKGYGQVRSELIRISPIIETVPATMTFPKVLEVPLEQFEGALGPGHKKGDTVTTPGTNINLTVLNISNNVSLSYNLPVGFEITYQGAPWNDTVIKVDQKNITVRHDVEKNDIIQYIPGVPWNTTVIDVDSDNITLRHNAIPNTTMQSMFGPPIRVSFNDTSIIMDSNHALAGKTLIFNITLRSIK
jgi:FKBP-type peptidyl-prolyl cis-trans isomerase 2